MYTRTQRGMKIMLKDKIFNYEAEDLDHFSTRIPFEYKALLKLKAAIDGVSVQDLVIYALSKYIVNDKDDDIKDLIQDFKVQVQKVVK